jgi:cadmium resistance protein CadD (predicted permease)
VNLAEIVLWLAVASAAVAVLKVLYATFTKVDNIERILAGDKYGTKGLVSAVTEMRHEVADVKDRVTKIEAFIGMENA